MCAQNCGWRTQNVYCDAIIKGMHEQSQASDLHVFHVTRNNKQKRASTLPLVFHRSNVFFHEEKEMKLIAYLVLPFLNILPTNLISNWSRHESNLKEYPNENPTFPCISFTFVPHCMCDWNHLLGLSLEMIKFVLHWYEWWICYIFKIFHQFDWMLPKNS